MIASPYKMGALAFSAGKSTKDNPFKKGTWPRIEWIRGFMDAQQKAEEEQK